MYKNVFFDRMRCISFKKRMYMQESTPLYRIRILFTYFSFCLLLSAICSKSVHAFYISEIPKEAQTKSQHPVERKIQLKLPLEQPMFHWMFLNRKDLLSGKLVLRIKRDSSTSELTIFNNGNFSNGWEAITFDLPREKAIGEIYFGFISSNKYLTAPGDEVEIELTVVKDLEGIGRLQKGILKAGVYISKGKFAIFDESLSGEPIAIAEIWEKQWPLIITSEEGWLPPQEAAKQREMQKMMQVLDKNNANQQNGKDKKTEAKANKLIKEMKRSYEEGSRKAKKQICIDNLRLINAAVSQYALDYRADKGTIPDSDIIWGNKDSYLRSILFCPEGKDAYKIPKVGELAVCPNIDNFPDHVSSE